MNLFYQIIHVFQVTLSQIIVSMVNEIMLIQLPVMNVNLHIF